MLVFGGSLARARSTWRAAEAFASAPFHVLHVCGRRDYPRARARGRPPGYDLREYLDLADFAERARRRRPRRSRAPAGRCSRSPPTGCRRSSCPTRTPSADHQSANARWMVRGGRRGRDRRRRADRPRGWPSEVAALLADRDAPARRWRAPRARLARPEAAARGGRRAARGRRAMSAARAGRGAGGACTSSASAAPG